MIMYIKKKRPWDLHESRVMSEDRYLGRRQFFRSAGVYSLGAGLFLSGFSNIFGLFEGGGDKEAKIVIPKTPTSYLYPAKRNAGFTLDRPLTDEVIAATYNNFYEFSGGKKVWKYVENFKTRPWQVEVTGLVEKPRIYDIDELIKEMPVEERLYRLRCVEAWAVAVPWTGFPMIELIKKARPLSSAKYVRMHTFLNTDWAPEQKERPWLPWPYEEGLTMAEATNELTLLATGIYGHELPKQHGSPIRLVVPWKYGYKSIKSIVRIEFTAEKPRTFWATVVPEEYGDFYANVDPDVPHPRWSQATERMADTGEIRQTMKYNGYGEYVAGLYRGRR